MSFLSLRFLLVAQHVCAATKLYRRFSDRLLCTTFNRNAMTVQ